MISDNDLILFGICNLNLGAFGVEKSPQNYRILINPTVGVG